MVPAGDDDPARHREFAVPKSKVRKKSVYTPPEGVLQNRASRARAAQPSPSWYAPLMATLLVLGLAWIVVYYVTGQDLTLPMITDLSQYNLVVGIGFMAVGFVYATHWE